MIYINSEILYMNPLFIFLGYNFYGIGGTVNATMALAESLLQEGYWVDALSLKRNTEIRHRPPYGLNMQYISWDNSGSIVEKINRRRYRSPKYYGHLEYDYVKKFLSPYVGYKLDDLMKNIKTMLLMDKLSMTKTSNWELFQKISSCFL